jgi:hypothetical protein
LYDVQFLTFYYFKGELMKVGEFVGGALIGAATGAAWGAACGAVGAAILLKAGYANYVVLEATRMGAVGSGLLGAVGFFKNKKEDEGLDSAALIYGQVVGGLIGYAAFHACAATTVMTLGKTAAALAVGTLAISAAIIVFALLAVAAWLVMQHCYGADTGNDDAMLKQKSRRK